MQVRFFVFFGGMVKPFFFLVTPFGSFGIPPCLVELSPLSCGCNSAGVVVLGVRRSFLECLALAWGSVRSLGVTLMTRSLNKVFSS